MTERSFTPPKTSDPSRTRWDVDRRSALKLLSTGLALGLTACGRPHEEIVPYVEMPERLVPGEPLKFATTLPLAGYGRGMLVTSVEGRPIKIEGNPRHPASLGSTDAFAEAAIMGLYDPDRSQAPRHGDDISTWNEFAGALQTQLEHERSQQGAGLRLVSGRVTSPTLLRQIDDMLKKFPQARWYRYEPISDDAVTAGAVMAYDKALTPLPRFGDAAVVLTLDADPLGPGPQQIVNARGYSRRRQKDARPFMRLYAVEPDWSLTGANADHRLTLHPDLISNFALAIAAALRNEKTSFELPPEATRFAHACAADLAANNGKALVCVGRRQPAELHALAHWINARLNAPLDLISPVDSNSLSHEQSLKAFAADLDQNRVETLIVMDANPVYDAPGHLGIGDQIAKLAFSAHLGLHDDESAARCQWHLPLSHTLESWSDLRAFNGSASIVQPLILPLYDSRDAHHLLQMISGASGLSTYQLVRQTWQASHPGGDFEQWWKQTLHDGFIANSAAASVTVGAPKKPDVAPAKPSHGMILTLAPDPSVLDGRFANNAWMLECAHPLTKDVWGNCLHLSVQDAKRFGVSEGDELEILHAGALMRGPVRIQNGQAAGVIAASLGYGRTRVGALGNGIGIDVYRLRRLATPWRVDDITVVRTGRRHPIPSFQHHFELEGKADELYPTLSLTSLAQGNKPPEHDEAHPATLYPQFDYDTYAWAMVIDTSVCIGCNACVVACQAENNVPVVGPDQVLAGRDMHWLRVDRYVPHPERPPGFQPVPCMQCEKAPCEPVCPVAASVHDGEGLNVQVYNRCIGTRFCQANCPYKVRRFNWFGYADGQEYADLGDEVVKAAYNPDVTVRARGVMEKCTYCVQRISRARRHSEKVDRPIPDGGVITACQSACPTRAISFGDKNNKASHVNAQRALPQHYELLGHLGTRPRTTYLAHLRNPNPILENET
jgi:Fe-S-cluster-containing dehydrogenase component